MIRIDNISKSFSSPDGRVQALKNISLTLEAGQLMAVQGPSGCGKTTLLLTAGTLLKPETGHVFVDGHDPYLLSPNHRSDLRAAKIGFVFQQFHLVPYLSVLENILVPCAANPKPTDMDRAKELIDHFNLADRIGHFPSQLSTGQCQRVALARALVNDPKLILADEPTGNLDEENAKIVLSYLAEFADKGCAVLIVTHDPYIGQFTHRTIRLCNGVLQN